MRLLIVDDDEVFGASLSTLLAQDGRFEVVGVAPDLDAATAAAAERSPDAALVDVLLRQHDGFEIVSTLRARHPKLVVLMMSGLDRSEYEPRALAAGADGVLTKGSFVHGGADAILELVRDAGDQRALS